MAIPLRLMIGLASSRILEAMAGIYYPAYDSPEI